MAVYVDFIVNYGWKLGPSCHMVADTVEELNALAKRIGLKPEWIQKSASEVIHYDLVESKRKLAVKYGAVEFKSWSEAAAKFKELKPIIK